MGRETPISFNLRNHVALQRPAVSAQQNKETRRAVTQTTLILI